MLHTLVFLKKEVVQATSPVTAYALHGDKLQNINLVLIHLQENEY
jgi:hypothetical protein